MKLRIVAFLLACLTVLPLAACAQEEEKEDKKPDSPKTTNADTADSSDTAVDTEPEDTLPEGWLSDDLAEANFDGRSFVIVGTPDRLETTVTSQELNDDDVNNAMYHAREDVQERFNVKISYRNLADGTDDFTTQWTQLMAAGDTSFQVGASLQMPAMSIRGICTELTDVEQFHFDQPYWCDPYALAIGNRIFASSSFLSYNCVRYARTFVVNKELAEDLNIDVSSLYEAVFNGTWTLDMLIALSEGATQDLDGDGLTESRTDQYAFSWSHAMLAPIQASMGCSVIRKNADGMPEYSFDIERASAYLEKFRTYVNTMAFKDEEKTQYGSYLFADNKVLFNYCNLREAINIFRESEVIYGFLPIPKWDESQEEYISTSNDTYLGVPSSIANDMEFVGTVTEAILCAHYNRVRPAMFERAVKGKLSDAPEDSQVLDLIINTLAMDFDGCYSSIITGVSELTDMISNGVRPVSLASKEKKVRTKVEKQLESVLNSWSKLE